MPKTIPTFTAETFRVACGKTPCGLWYGAGSAADPMAADAGARSCPKGCSHTNAQSFPAGSSAFVHNISCYDCYQTKSTVAIYVAYMSDASSRVALVKDTDFAITAFTVSQAEFVFELATVNATFHGLSENEVYLVRLLCTGSPEADSHFTFTANSTSPTIVYTTLPGHCYDYVDWYLIIASSDEAHIAVRTLFG